MMHNAKSNALRSCLSPFGYKQYVNKKIKLLCLMRFHIYLN